MSIDHKDIIINALTFQIASIMEVVNNNEPKFARADTPATPPATHEQDYSHLTDKIRELEIDLADAHKERIENNAEFEILASFFINERSELSRELSQYIVNQCSAAIHNTPSSYSRGMGLLYYFKSKLPTNSEAAKDFHRARELMKYAEKNK